MDISINDERTKCEIWQRTMGYFRPVSDYNIGKLQEYKDRKSFKEKNINTKKLVKVG